MTSIAGKESNRRDRSTRVCATDATVRETDSRQQGREPGSFCFSADISSPSQQRAVVRGDFLVLRMVEAGGMHTWFRLAIHLCSLLEGEGSHQRGRTLFGPRH